VRILFISDNFPPEVNAPASRTFEHCREWVKSGVEVTVITCAPNFPKGKVQDGFKNRLWQKSEIEGIRVIRVWSYISSNEGFLKRILDYMSFMVTAFFASLFVKTDLIVATSPQFFAAVGGFLSHFFKRKPWVMEVRDLWPESIRAVGAMSGEGKMFRFLEKIELFLYKNAKAVVVVTDAFRENLIERGISSDKIFVIKNGVLLDQFIAKLPNEKLLDELHLRGKFVFGYMGTHGMAHGLDFVLKTVKNLENLPIHFLFVGDGAVKANLLELQKNLRLINVTFLPSVSKAEMVDFISITDAALVPLKKSDTFKSVLPSKIFENAAMQKPILLGVEGEAQKLVEKYQAGLCFEPENEADFLEKVQKMAFEKAKYADFQAGCATLAADFNRKKLAVDLLNILKKCV
jgi:glycosyltransferase involved in cell wall biosynthesis